MSLYNYFFHNNSYWAHARLEKERSRARSRARRARNRLRVLDDPVDRD